MNYLTPRIVCEVLSHEAIVLEAYLDSKGIWTWAGGVTNASGHRVHPRYLDKPQTLQRCLEVSIWLMQNVYLPPVLRAFAGYELSEHELGAALSFHYNTGKIESASWVHLVKQGKTAEAKKSFMQWKNPPEILKRRSAECDLFFSGAWSNDGAALVYPVRKPSYQPDFRNVKRVAVKSVVEQIMGGS